MANILYGTGCSRMVVGKKDINPAFFDLSTKIAGIVFQKFVTYQMRLAVVGDFSSGCSSSLRPFILESNKEKGIYFTDDEEKAMNWLIS
jgi:ABC-type branched-subunit amino acid transport system substrate-binding protein